MDFFVNVMLRSWRVDPKVSASMSSVPTAWALPPRTSSAHCASASHGASTTGTPMSRRSCLTSSQSFRETLVSSALYLEMPSASSFSVAFLSAASASWRFAVRFASSPPFMFGGLPSKT